MKFSQRDDNPKGNNREKRIQNQGGSSTSPIRGTPPIRLLLLLVDMVSLGLSLPAMPGLVSQMAGGERRWDSRQNGLGLVVFGLAAMFSQAAVFPRMLKRFSLPKICLSGPVFYTLSFLA